MNKSFILLIVVILFSSNLYAQPLPYEKINAYANSLNELVKSKLTVKELKLLGNAESNVFKKVYIDTLSDQGYDYSDTIEKYSLMLLNEDYALDQEQTLILFLNTYVPNISDLEKLQKAGIVKEKAVNAVKKLPRRYRPNDPAVNKPIPAEDVYSCYACKKIYNKDVNSTPCCGGWTIKGYLCKKCGGANLAYGDGKCGMCGGDLPEKVILDADKPDPNGKKMETIGW